MSTQPPLDPAELVRLLTRQCDLYRRLAALSGQQRNLIAGNRPELLLQVLRERQDAITGLARLNDQLAPYRRDWETIRNALPDAARQQALDLLDEINRLLKSILETDQEDTALLSARKQAVGQTLSDINGGRTANAAYGRAAATPRDTSADITG